MDLTPLQKDGIRDIVCAHIGSHIITGYGPRSEVVYVYVQTHPSQTPKRWEVSKDGIIERV